MTRYLGPKTDPANVATQSDVGGSTLSDSTPDALTPDQAGAAGTANAAARADHAHEIACAAAGAILPDDVAAEGTASSFARADHTHSISAAAPGTIQPDAAAAEGSSTSFARADHTHAIVAAAPATNLTASTTNAEGNATSFARSNHTHAIDTAAPSANLSATTTNTEGTATSFARSDHSHAITTGSAGTISGTIATGTSASLARADHDHALGANVVGTTQIADSAVTKAKVDATIYGKAQTISALTGSGTLTASDLGKLVTVNSGSAATLTISGTILAAGERVDILQLGAGQVTLAGTLNTVVGTPGLKLRAQYSACTLYGLGGGTHVAIGDLAA